MNVTNKTLIIGVVVVLAIAALTAVLVAPRHFGPPGRMHGGPRMMMMGGPGGPAGGPPGGRGGPGGGPPPRAEAATIVAYNGVVYVAADGKVTALDAKTLNRVAEGVYSEGPGRGGR